VKIGQILENFRLALGEVAQRAQNVGIPWRRPEAYDEWDQVASALFVNLVCVPLRWSLPVEEQDEFRIPPYDLIVEWPPNQWLIEVVHGELPRGRWMFHAFGSRGSPFDLVEVRQAPSETNPSGSEIVECSLPGCGFHLVRGRGMLSLQDLNDSSSAARASEDNE